MSVHKFPERCDLNNAEDMLKAMMNMTRNHGSALLDNILNSHDSRRSVCSPSNGISLNGGSFCASSSDCCFSRSELCSVDDESEYTVSVGILVVCDGLDEGMLLHDAVSRSRAKC